MEPWAYWLIAAGILLVLEMMTLTFYLLWICIGAVAGGILSLFAPDAYVLQVIVASLVALVLTIFTKPLTRRIHGAKGYEDTGIELVGKQGIVVEPIEQGQYGIVKVGGDTWSATSIQQLDRDELVRVIKRGSSIIEVERWEELT